ncbi:unnamed protein product [Malus baccata var. baccata]
MTKSYNLNIAVPGAVCASTLARNGVSVTLLESARVPGRRMEVVEDGKELLFDHCAPFFNANNTEVLGLVHEWESRGLVPCWKEKFGFFDHISNKFVDPEQWLEDENLWSLIGSDGQNLGQFKGVVARDKNLVSLREGPFPAASVAREEKCLWDKKKRLAICGDFCVSPNVEGAIASRIAAASKLTEILSCL